MVRDMLRSVVGVLVAVSAATAHAEILIGAAAPLTGDNSWYGEQIERAVGMAVADLNEAGGILGQTVRAITVDDYCRGDQAVAARRLVAGGVVFVAGHLLRSIPCRSSCTTTTFTFSSVSAGACAAP